MIRLEIGLEIIHSGVMRVCAIEDNTAVVVVVASYRSVSRNPVRFKALVPRFNNSNKLRYASPLERLSR